MATNAVMTWEEFLAAGKEGQRWEYVDGEVAFMSPVLRPHGRVNAQLDYELVAYTRQHPEWVVYGTDTTFSMASGNWRCPDAALVRKEWVDSADPDSLRRFRLMSPLRFSHPTIPAVTFRANATTILRATQPKSGSIRTRRAPKSFHPIDPPSTFAQVRY